MQRQFEPLARSVRDLGDAMAAFDRAVLAFLRADSDDNRSATAEAAARLSQSVNQAAQVGTTAQADKVRPVLVGIAERQAEGFRLLDLQDERRRNAAALDQDYADLLRRALGGGGAGVVVGDNVLVRPSLTYLTRAIETARAAASAAVSRHGEAPPAMIDGEKVLRHTFEAHREEWLGAPGQVWVDLMDEDLSHRRGPAPPRAAGRYRNRGASQCVCRERRRAGCGGAQRPRDTCLAQFHRRGGRGAFGRRDLGTAHRDGDCQGGPAGAAGACNHGLGDHLAGAPADRGRPPTGGR